MVLEYNGMDEGDIDKIFMVTTDPEEMTKMDLAIKDTIDLYFNIEDEGELISSLRCCGIFKSLK